MNDGRAATADQLEITMRAMEDQLARLAAEVDRLTQRDAIKAVLARYARAIDRHDSELQEEVFWPDAVINYGKFTAGRDKFVQWGNAGHESAFVQHEHHMTNQTVEIDGDQARAETYVIFMLRHQDGKSGKIGGARYLDALERRDGVWKIASRIFLPDFHCEVASIFSPAFAEGWCPGGKQGAWDRTDLSYAHLGFADVGAAQFAAS